MAEQLPQIHFVTGFLGSGKTTAIVGLTRFLQEEGVRVGVVTNDQGRRQVDQSFVQASGIPSVAVSNGCFCCRYDDFEERVLSLSREEQPEVVFAESVGSCADVVATVVKPFDAFRQKHSPPGTITTFVDARMLEARYSEKRLPFSDGVLYIFDKQIEEAALLVINKRDLLTTERAQALRKAAERRFPEKKVLLHSALQEEDLQTWYRELTNLPGSGGRSPESLTAIDYRRYGSAEQELAWLDFEGVVARKRDTGSSKATPTLTSASRETDRDVLTQLIARFARLLDEEGAPLGHLKVVITGDAAVSSKISLTAAGSNHSSYETTLSRQIPVNLRLPVRVLLNARVMADAEVLERSFERAVSEVAAEAGLTIEKQFQESFVPGFPKPVHRLS